MALDRPVHARGTLSRTAAPAAAAPAALEVAVHGDLAILALSGRQAGRDYLPETLAPDPLTIPGAVHAQSDPTDLTRPIVDGLIALEWDVSARNAASISGAARVGEAPAPRIPEFADAHGLRHATFTCRCTPDDGVADAGIPDATGTTCSRSDEDGGTSINARVPFPDHRDHQETFAGDPVAYPMGPRQALRDLQVEAGDPALSVTSPPPVAGDRARVLRHWAQSSRVQSRKASGSCLETHSAYRSSAGLRSCDCAYDIPKFTTARCGRVDSR